MKWFMHLSGAHNDNEFNPFLDKWGMEGHGTFFTIMELMSDNFNVFKPGVCHLFWTTMTKACRMRKDKLRKVLLDAGKIAHNKGIYPVFDDDGAYLNCPKLKELADNWTQRELKRLAKRGCVAPPPTTEELQSNNVVTPSIDKIREDKNRVDKSRKRVSPPPIAGTPLGVLVTEYHRLVSSSEHPIKTRASFEDNINRSEEPLTIVEIQAGIMSGKYKGISSKELCFKLREDKKKPYVPPTFEGFKCNHCKDMRLLKTGKMVKVETALGPIEKAETIPCPKCGEGRSNK